MFITKKKNVKSVAIIALVKWLLLNNVAFRIESSTSVSHGLFRNLCKEPLEHLMIFSVLEKKLVGLGVCRGFFNRRQDQGDGEKEREA